MVNIFYNILQLSYLIGGLSSFSLFLIVVAYIKYPKVKTRINLGRIFMEMLEVYGKFFNYAQTVIDVNLFK